jgi:hypothetical protein
MDDDTSLPEFGTPFRVLIDHCESKNLSFRIFEEHKTVAFTLHGEVATYDIGMFVSHDDQLFQVYVTLPVAVADPKMRPLVTEFATRANNQLAIGKFDFEIEEGKLRFHASHAFWPGVLEDETIDRLMGSVISTVDRYFPALMRVMFGGITPTDAVYLSELDYHSEREVEEEKTEPIQPRPANKPLPAKKKRRLRKDPRLKHTKELPGLFDQTGSQDQ